MSEISKTLSNAEKMNEVGLAVAEALGDAIKKHPKEAILISGALCCLYIIKDKKFKLKLKRQDFDFELETE